MTASKESEDKVLGGFPKVDDSLRRLRIHDPLCFNRGDTKEALSPLTENLTGIEFSFRNASGHVVSYDWGQVEPPHLARRYYQIQTLVIP